MEIIEDTHDNMMLPETPFVSSDSSEFEFSTSSNSDADFFPDISFNQRRIDESKEAGKKFKRSLRWRINYITIFLEVKLKMISFVHIHYLSIYL